MHHTGSRTQLSASEAAQCGMGLAVIARDHPDRLAVASPHGDRSFDFLNARANQLVRALRARGLRPGDGVALLCSNRPELAVALYATLRGGWRFTPVNWHLTPGEIAYIVDNCEAKAFLAEARFGHNAARAARETPRSGVRLAIGDAIPGFDPFDSALEEQSADDIDDPVLGSQMLYTSGTTGRPKGVSRTATPAERRVGLRTVAERVRYHPGRDLHLCTGPLYHAAPLAFSLSMPLSFGCGVVMMDRFDPERALQLIAGYRVSHTHMVPTMFHRLLALPEEVRGRYDLSSLRVVLHGAAPCPVETKRALLEWLGPVVFEYYAATEGWGSFVTPEEWLERPGSVGRPEPGQVEIRDQEGDKVQPPGTPGLVYLRASGRERFEYFKDPDKTKATFSGDYFTLGDVGYVDAEGYLFLCDRSADVIISGGVTIFPAEVDAVLLQHPAVGDAATIGVPNEEWGEEVLTVVEVVEGQVPSHELAEELVAHCRANLAGFKCPRRVEFVEELPRRDTGKIYRRLLRDHYWADREKKI